MTHQQGRSTYHLNNWSILSAYAYFYLHVIFLLPEVFFRYFLQRQIGNDDVFQSLGLNKSLFYVNFGVQTVNWTCYFIYLFIYFGTRKILLDALTCFASAKKSALPSTCLVYLLAEVFQHCWALGLHVPWCHLFPRFFRFLFFVLFCS